MEICFGFKAHTKQVELHYTLEQQAALCEVNTVQLIPLLFQAAVCWSNRGRLLNKTKQRKEEI
jgi:hypothetical protein